MLLLLLLIIIPKCHFDTDCLFFNVLRPFTTIVAPMPFQPYMLLYLSPYYWLQETKVSPRAACESVTFVPNFMKIGRMIKKKLGDTQSMMRIMLR